MRVFVKVYVGCMVIVYDLLSDTKINLVQHSCEVQALAFSPPGAGNSHSGGEFLISIDYSKTEEADPHSYSSSTMCLWNYTKGTCLQEIQIPKSQTMSEGQTGYSSQNKPLLSIIFPKVGSFFFILETSSSTIQGGYRISAWVLSRQQRIEFVGQYDLELQNCCLGMMIMGSLGMARQSVPGSMKSLQSQTLINSIGSQKSQFITIERNCIKLWNFIQNQTELIKKIHIKQNLKSCIVSELTGFLFILGDNGKVLILDQEGEFVSTIQTEMQHFTTIAQAHDKVLLGTERGTIYVYHMASLAFISEIPYQLSMLKTFNLNDVSSIFLLFIVLEQTPETNQKHFTAENRYGLDIQEENITKFKIGPPVEVIATTHNQRFLLIKYQDSSFVMIDRSATSPQTSILGYQYGHFESVTGLQWLHNPSKRSSYANPLFSTPSQSHPSDIFVTCSSDMSIFIWKQFGDRWSFSYIDTVKCFDSSLSCQRKHCEKSTQSLALTAVYVYPRSPFLVVGDNKGVLRVFQIGNDQALFVGAYRVGEVGVEGIWLNKEESVAVVSFQTGLICAFDIRNGYNLLGTIEQDAQRFAHTSHLQVNFCIIEPPSYTESSFHKEIFKKQDERPFMNTTFDSEIGGIGQGGGLQFRVVAQTAPNCLKLQNVEVKGHKLILTPLVQFVIAEGRISGFSIHPSQDYLLVTSTKGRIYVYRIDTGELRGTIQIPLYAKGCCIDPSGLYVMVQVPPFNPKFTHNIQEYQELEDLSGTLGYNPSALDRTTLLLFEIGTGIAASEIKSVFEVTHMKFSPDGKYLALGSNLGCVSVWALGEHLVQNVKQVIDQVQMQNDFWSNYPIFLPDYQTYGMMQTHYTEDPYPKQLYSEETPSHPETPTHQPHQIPQYSHKKPYISHEPDIDYHSSNQKHQIYHNQQIQTHNQIYKDQNTQVTASSNRIHNGNQVIQNKYIKKSPEKGVQVDQNKFIRKTFVEDQYTQMTQNLSQQQNQSHSQQYSKQTYPQQQSLQIQNSVHNQNIPYNQQSFGYKQDLLHLKQQSVQTKPQQDSYHNSPNKAELLYRPAYISSESQKSLSYVPSKHEDNFLDPNLRPIYNSGSPYKRLSQPNPYVEYIPGNQEVIREQRKDFIDRAQNIQIRPLSMRQSVQNSPPKENLVIERNNYQQPYIYEEHYNPSDQYNPFVGGALDQKRFNSTLYDTKKSNNPPISSINLSPQHPDHNIQGRIIGSNQKERKVAHDPVDIDDDVSDHGPDSLEHQMRDLDIKNKYLQHIRIPTRVAGDNFIEDHGYQDSEKAFTLERLRRIERGEHDFEADLRRGSEENLSRSSSTVDIVEQMYEHLDNFDKKIKREKLQNSQQFF